MQQVPGIGAKTVLSYCHFAVLQAMADQQNSKFWKFCSSSFEDFSSEILHGNVTDKCRNSSAAVWYILMYSLDFWIVNWKLINRYHFSCFVTGLSLSSLSFYLAPTKCFRHGRAVGRITDSHVENNHILNNNPSLASWVDIYKKSYCICYSCSKAFSQLVKKVSSNRSK